MTEQEKLAQRERYAQMSDREILVEHGFMLYALTKDHRLVRVMLAWLGVLTATVLGRYAVLPLISLISACF